MSIAEWDGVKEGNNVAKIHYKQDNVYVPIALGAGATLGSYISCLLK